MSAAPFYWDERAALYVGDCLAVLARFPDRVVQCCVTSPPYWGLRDYGVEGQLGLEPTPEEYVSALVAVFREVRRVLRDDGTLWLNLGDSYAGSWGAQSRGDDYPGSLQGGSMLSARQIQAHPKRTGTGSLKRTPGLKNKDLVDIPWRVAFALQADGWWLRSDVIWRKPNPMPESVTDRPTKAHEYVFLLAKSETYFYDADAVREPHTMKPQRRLKQRASARDAAMRADKKYYYALRDTPGVEGNPRGRNRRYVWSIATRPFKGAHFATFPPALVEPCILAGSRPGDVVLDPFNGAGTTGLVAVQHGRRYVGVELNEAYARLTLDRWRAERLAFSETK